MKLSELPQDTKPTPTEPPQKLKLSDLPSSESTEKKEPSLWERTKEVGKEGLTGAAFGAIAPELLTYGVAPLMAISPMAPAAPFVATAGQALKGARLASTVMGGVGGLTGETAGQVTESKYGPGVEAEVARFLGGTLGPVPVGMAGDALKKMVGSTVGSGAMSLLGAMGVPGMRSAKTIGQMLENEQRNPGSLTAEQRAFIEKQIQDIRGGKSSLDAQKEVYQMLKSSTEKTKQTAFAQADQLEQQAQGILQEAQGKAQALTPELEKRISNLQSQLNTEADKIRATAKTEGDKIIQEANSRAAKIREEAKSKSDNLRQLSEIEAKEAISQGQKQADALTKQAIDQEKRLRQYRDKVINITKSSSAEAQQAIAKVGQATLPTDRGNAIREGFNNVLKGFKEQRDKVVEQFKKPVFDAALLKEQQGGRVEKTAAFQQTIKDIDAMITNPQGLTDIPVSEIKNALLRAKGYLDPRTVLEDGTVVGQPISFNGLDIVRRYLRDRASGLPAEGYDAISQQQAGKIAEKIESIMEEFSPGFLKYKEAYRDASKPINEIKTRFGRAVTDKPEGYDVGQYVRDASTLGSAAFSSKGTVQQLIGVLGKEQAEKIARGYVADEIRNPTAAGIKSFLNKPNVRDWIGQFPNLEKDLRIAEQAATKGEKLGIKGKSLESALGNQLSGIPKLNTEAKRVEEAGLSAAEQIKQKAEREALRIEKPLETKAERTVGAGERLSERTAKQAESQIDKAAGDVAAQRERLTKEAEQKGKDILGQAKEAADPLTTQAKAVRQKAEENAKLILGTQTDAERIRSIITGSNAAEWEATANIVLSSSGGKEKFAQAVSQIIADKATTSLKGAINDMKYIGDNLITYKLMSPKQVQEIQSKLQDVFVAPISMKEKATMAQRLVRNAIVGYVAIVPPRTLGD
jgi:cell division septum initiation protein DivIVA